MRESSELLLHFDTNTHTIRAEALIDTTQQVVHLVNLLNEAIFDELISLQVYAEPAEEGGYKQALVISGRVTKTVSNVAFKLGTGMLGLATLFDIVTTNPVINDYFKTVTGRTIPEHVHEFAERQATDLSIEEVLDPYSTQYSISNSICALLATLAQETLTPKDQVALSQFEHNEITHKIDHTRAQFYQACLSDPKIQGLGFDDADIFPIQRSRFAELALEPAPLPEEPETSVRATIITSRLSITSPNWDQHDQSRRGWVALDSSFHQRYFTVDDERFWAFARADQIPMKFNDEMVAQILIEEGASRKRSFQVLRVLTYNNMIISEELTDDEIADLLGDQPDDPHNIAPTLF